MAYVAVLAICALSVFPNGYMLSQKNGTIAITLCTQEGNVEAFMRGDGTIVQEDDQAPHENPSDTGPCDFAFHSVALTLNPPILLPDTIAVQIVEAAITFNDDLAPGRGLAAPPPPKTGPPSISET